MAAEEKLKKYIDALKSKYDNYMRIMDEWGTVFFYEKHIVEREKLHLDAISCINEMLPPELKIFIRNLCANQLGYPDEVIFYKLFGNTPEIGKCVTKEDFEKKWY